MAVTIMLFSVVVNFKVDNRATHLLALALVGQPVTCVSVGAAMSHDTTNTTANRVAFCRMAVVTA